jgi:hypothetical protein
VETVEIGKKGGKFLHWKVELYQGNPPEWLRKHLDHLAKEIQKARAKAGVQATPESIDIVE